MEFENKYVKNGVLYIDKYVEDVDMIVGKFAEKVGIAGLINQIIVEEDNPVYYCKDNCLLRKSNNELVIGCNNSIIPNCVSVIEHYAFSGCSFTTIEIPQSVKTIYDGAFQFCEQLKEIKFPNGLEVVENDLFWGCISLEKIYIPNSVEYIGSWAFLGCENLREIVLPNNLQALGEFCGAFSWCLKLERIVLPTSLWSIYPSTFWHCESLKMIYIPKNIEIIREDAFAHCYSLEEVIFENTDNWIYGEFETDEEGKIIKERDEWGFRHDKIKQEYPVDVCNPKQNAQLLKNKENKLFCLYRYIPTEEVETPKEIETYENFEQIEMKFDD